MAHFNFVISQNAKWGHASFYIDRHRMTSLLTCAWLISILWLVLGLQSKIKICIPENILLQKSTANDCPLISVALMEAGTLSPFVLSCHYLSSNSSCFDLLWICRATIQNKSIQVHNKLKAVQNQQQIEQMEIEF